MKKFFVVLFAFTILAGCAGMSGTEGDSTKQWIKIDSSKSSFDGGAKDVCYRLNIRFNPPQALNGINTDAACITKCCWYSEHKTVTINLNDAFAGDLAENGAAYKYTPEKLTFYISYSSFLNTIHGRIEPKSALKSDGLIKLDYTEIKNQNSYLNVGNERVKAAVYDEETGKNTHSVYLFKKDNPAQNKSASAASGAMPNQEQPSNFINAQEREEYLQKILAYEREQAVALLKRFYNKDIDAYIMTIDKAQKSKGMILLANDRNWITTKIGYPIYRVACKVNGKLGKTSATMKNYPMDCGVYEVHLDEQTVKPVDSIGRNIATGEYKN
ncbi:MAG: hypothetical protein LBG46_02680 [Elusimicrobiota bacterium]|jgi:hypothetical protein|nr:hypothetical protein [Elusimicrobiota bacterium]